MTIGGREEGLHLYDVSDPTRARLLGAFRGEFLDVLLSGARAYLPAGAPGLVVLDIANPRLPTKVSQIDPGDHVRTGPQAGVRIGRQGGALHSGVVDLRVEGNLVYVAALEAGLLVWDLTDPLAPKQIGQFQTPGYAEAVEIDREGTIAYVSNNVITPFTLWAIDVRDPSKPASLGEFEGGETISGGISQLRAADDRLYYLTYNTGYVMSWTLGVVRFGGPVESGAPPAPRLVGELSHHGFPWDLEIENGTAYVADAEGVSVLTFAADGTPEERSRLVGTSPVKQIAVENGHAFLFGDSGMHVVDVTRPAAPVSVAQLDLNARSPYRIQEGVAYFEVGTGRGDLDLSNPADPRWKDRDEDFLPGWCDGWARLPVGNYCYRITYAGAAVGVIVDVLEGGEPVTTLQVPLGAGPWLSRDPLAAHSRYVYVLGRQGVYVLDPSNPATPYLVALKPIDNGTFSLISAALSPPRGVVVEYPAFGIQWIAILNGKAYVLSGGLWVFDLSDPIAPVEIAYYETDAHALVVDGDVVYLAGPSSELQIVQVAIGQVRAGETTAR